MEKKIIIFILIAVVVALGLYFLLGQDVQSSPCSDECSVGETQCVGSQYQERCGDFDSDSCNDWGGKFYCANGCNLFTFSTMAAR